MIVLDPVTLGDAAFSRPWPKWVYDKTGALVQVPANAPAVTHDPANLRGAPYVLIEAEARNRATYSQDFTNAVWSKSQLSVVADVVLAPDGAVSADKLIPTTSSTAHLLSRQYTVEAGKSYTWSRFVKAAGYDALQVRFAGALQHQSGSDQALSEALAQGIHHGAVVDAFLYDTSKDSDGGAWIGRCQLTSWENEPLCPGAWRGQQTNLAAAWNVAGAAAGDYYQNTTDGKFYMIGGTQAAPTHVEVFRGNGRRFPARAGIVAEAGRVVFYDLTQPGAPMWMVFANGYSGATSIVAMNGCLWIGRTAGGVIESNFVSDFVALRMRSAGLTPYMDRLSNRNASWAVGSSLITLVNNSVNDIAAAVLPGAPVDPATGLPVPTVAIASAGGVSVIKDNGTVVNSVSTVPADRINIDNRSRINWTYYGHVVETKPIPELGAGFAQTGVSAGPLLLGTTDYSVANNQMPSPLGYMTRVERDSAGGVRGLVRIKRGNTVVTSMAAAITNAYSSGWLCGDSRGAWLADTVAETIAGTQLVANGAFDANIDGVSSGLGGTVSWQAGRLRVTRGTEGAGGRGVIALATQVGKRYRVTLDIYKLTGANTAIAITTSAPSSSGAIYVSGVIASDTSATFEFTATQASHWLFMEVAGGDGAYSEFDNISVKLAEPDRSVKNKGLIVNGTLTKAPVAAGAQLVGYSGFTASNYLEQSYNPDLDFGTGDFCVMGWVTLTAPTSDLFFHRSALGNDAGQIAVYRSNATSALRFHVGTTVATNRDIPLNTPTLITLLRRAGIVEVWADNSLVTTAANAFDLSLPDAITRIGSVGRIGSVFSGPLSAASSKLALWRVSATAPSADQIAQIYRDELALFQPNAKCTIDGTSTAVTALAYDDSTDVLHVGTSWGRSSFSGLQRIESEATPVGAIASLAAGGGAVITAGSGARVVAPAARYYVPNFVDRVATFDLARGEVAACDTDLGVTAGIQDVGNGYFRVSLSGVARAAGEALVQTLVAKDAAAQVPLFAGDGASGLLAWQEDFVEASTVSSPIPTVASPVTRAADVLSTTPGLVYSNVAETEPLWVAGTYAKGARVRDAAHVVYESLVDNNSARLPSKADANWLRLGATNRWAMFDDRNNTQTSNPEEIVVVLSPRAIAQGLLLGNVDASEVTVSVTVPNFGVVYRETASMVVPTSNSSFFRWGFNRIRRKTLFLSLNLPIFFNGVVTVSIRRPGGVAKCGMCLIGPTVEPGPTLLGLSTEIKDYSTTLFNSDGSSETTPRGYRKLMSMDVSIDTDKIVEAEDQMIAWRQKSVVWIGAASRPDAVLVGRYSSFKKVIESYPRSKMALQIEGVLS